MIVILNVMNVTVVELSGNMKNIMSIKPVKIVLWLLFIWLLIKIFSWPVVLVFGVVALIVVCLSWYVENVENKEEQK